MTRVVVESPYRGRGDSDDQKAVDQAENVRYARLCVMDCLRRGEYPFASHLFYTQPGLLDDAVEAQRNQGIEAGLQWARSADKVAYYVDRGWTTGMMFARVRHEAEGRLVEERTLPGYEDLTARPRLAYFFGVLVGIGHHMYGFGREPVYAFDRKFHADGGPHLDGNYAPRQGTRHDVRGRLVWSGQGATTEERRRISSDSEERPQGEYLLHRRGGFTLMAWWDRCQGDERGGCNSVFLLEGEHDGAAMRLALERYFPRVLDNLRRAGVALREASP